MRIMIKVDSLQNHIEWIESQPDSEGRDKLLAYLAEIHEHAQACRERQLEGIARAKAEGKYTGRKATINTKKIKEYLNMGLRPVDVMRIMDISRSTVYRVKEEMAS